MLQWTREVLKKYGISPKKYLGQNFLVDKEALKEIIKAAELKKNDVVLEIGPGFGILTKELAKRVKKVIAIEKDERLVKILLSRSGLTQIGTRNNAEKNIEIVQGDILKFNPNAYRLGPNAYKVIANLPYYITSPVIRKFLENKNPPKLMVLMVQKEVAQRICAKPPHMSLLSVACQFYSKPKIVRIVKKESFWPAPRVDSAIIKIVPRDSASKEIFRVNPLLFFKIVKAGFSQPRKQLKNNLPKNILEKAGVDPTRRAETLSVEEWIKIYYNGKIEAIGRRNIK
jgi:16S rRNA (adenine1518-N6/adenine1519-N6)-dimethyltransferase